ncbi:hypothetical protein ATO13_21301 [Stappia sp. 22II-S9-Z10]|nr:hypothetical protein ATO13_21301 [Stappia sp. 22II-S9-Z10]
MPRLAGALAAQGAEVGLMSVAGRTMPAAPPGVALELFPHSGAGLPLLSALRRSPELAGALAARAPYTGILHVHGLWQMPCVYPARAVIATGSRARLVVSPRGMLAPAALAFSGRRKRLFWAALQGRAVAAATCLHATAASELEDIRAFGLATPVAVIPNGIDLPDLDVLGHKPVSRTILSLGRIHPKKGLDRLVRAFATASARTHHPGWRLRIVGPAEGGHDRELVGLARSLGAAVSVEPPVFGPAKFALYRNAELFVLATLNENFGLTVAEALAAGTPVVSTRGAPWSALPERGCGWWIDHGVAPLTAALEEAMGLSPAVRADMGARGRAYVASEFSWDRIAADMADVYRWLVAEGPLPSSVNIL